MKFVVLFRKGGSLFKKVVKANGYKSAECKIEGKIILIRRVEA